MLQLNLPSFQPNIKRMDNGAVKILDTLRHKFVALTPEEWVRQHFVHYLIEHLHYPAPLMANEVALSLNGMSRRCDTVIYSRAEGRPLMIIEYKAPEVNISQRVFSQISRYNIVMKVDWLVVSNGLRHYCCHIDQQTGTCQFVEGLPDYEDLLQDEK